MFENIYKYIRPPAHRSEKNDDITVFNTAHLSALHIINLLMSDQMTDPVGNCAGFELPCRSGRLIFKDRIPFRVFFMCHGEQDLRVELSVLELRIRSADDKSCLMIVSYSSHAGDHKLFKETVCGVEHLVPAPEVLSKVDAGTGKTDFCTISARCLACVFALRSNVRVFIFRRFICRIRRIIMELPHKEIRSRMAETVNTLFDVTYAEVIVLTVLYPADRRKDRFLQIITVLVLVAHNFPEPLRELSGGFPAAAVLIPQDLQRKMLEIREVHNFALTLLLSVAKTKILDDIDECVENRGIFRHGALNFFRRITINIFCQIIFNRLGFRAIRLEYVPESRIFPGSRLLCRQSGRFTREIRANIGDSLRVTFKCRQLLKEPEVILRHRKIGRRPIRTIAKCHILLSPCKTVPDKQVGVPHVGLHPCCLFHCLIIVGGVVRTAHLQPPVRPRLALCCLENLYNDIFHHSVRFAGSKALDEILKFRP